MKRNGLLPGVPPGTLAANLPGAFVIGTALAWAAGAIGVHVGGSLLTTLAGYATWQWLRLR
jgi:fluoride ion exporter CrcB/FEX